MHRRQILRSAAALVLSPWLSTQFDTTPKAIAAARAFLAMLNSPQRALVKLELNDVSRTKWSNLPSDPDHRSLRNGIAMRDLNAAQQDAALALVAATLSVPGYQKVLDILNGEEARLPGVAPPPSSTHRIHFDVAEYQIAVLGEPSISEPWMIQFGGHHLGLNLTLLGSQIAMTPSHFGSEPTKYNRDGQLVRPLGNENDKSYALIQELRPDQQEQAILLNHPVSEAVLGPGHDDEVPPPEGIRGSNLNAKQQAMLSDLIKQWVGILNDSAAAAKMAEIRANIGDTYFAWSGPTTNGRESYFRIQGPTVEAEYAPQGGSNHVHTFYRDPTNDYGAKFTRK